MILTRLRLENFKRYVNFELEFGEGLIGVIGKNGSGKSTIFEAILFALYGEFKSRGQKDLVRNSNATAKDAVAVELAFEFEGLEYRVIREFRGKNLSANAKLFKTEELTTSGAREVTNAIVALTKMSKDAFTQTLFASQKELTSLSSLNKEDRKRMIRRLLGLEKIDFIEKELVEKSRELKRSITAFDEILLSQEEANAKETQLKELDVLKKSLEKERAGKTKELEALKKVESKTKEELEVFVKAKESKQKAQSQTELTKSAINAETQTQAKLQQEMKELDAKAEESQKLSHVKEEHSKLQETLKTQEKLKEFHLKKEGLTKELVQLREQYTKASNDITTLSKECEAYEELLAKEKLSKESLERVKKDVAQTQKSERALNARVSAEKRVIEDANAKIQKIQNLGADSACPTCTRPLLEEYDNVLSSLGDVIKETQESKIEKFEKELFTLQTRLQEFLAQLNKNEKELQTLLSQLTLIQSKRRDLQSAKTHFENVKLKGLSNKEELEKLKEYSYDEETHKKATEELNAIKSVYEKVLSLQTQLQRHASVKEEFVKIGVKLQELNESFKTQEAAFKLINYDEKQHKEKSEDFNALKKTKEETTALINAINVDLAQKEGERKTIQATLDNNKTQLKKVQTKKEDLKDYEKIKLSLVAFKTKLNAQVAPRISSVASTMYSQITKGKYQHIEVNNDFDFFIYDDGKKYPIERFSGGEIDLANLVLRIAISRTLTELSGANSIGFLAFDEIFGSQDEARRLEILEAFHTIKEQYRQIFLISHEMEIKEMFESVVEL